MKSESNVKRLIKVFDPEKGLKEYEEMPKKLSLKQTISWLSSRVKQFKVDKVLMKQLNDEGRLIPDSTNFLGIKYYSKA